MSITNLSEKEVSPTKTFNRPGLKQLSVNTNVRLQKIMSPVSISTYSTIFQQSESLSIIRDVFIPEGASEKEKKIHQFLNENKIYQVNVKFMLEEDSKVECKSPKLQAELQNRKSTSSPSFLAKRMLSKNLSLKTNASQGENTPCKVDMAQTFEQAQSEVKKNPFKKSQYFIASNITAFNHIEFANVERIEEELQIVEQ